MKKIWKFDLHNANTPEQPDIFHFEMPKGAKVIHLGNDPNGQECVWVEFDVTQETNLVPRMFQIFGTGHLVPPLSTHLRSWINGPFVWHLYDHGEALRPLGA